MMRHVKRLATTGVIYVCHNRLDTWLTYTPLRYSSWHEVVTTLLNFCFGLRKVIAFSGTHDMKTARFVAAGFVHNISTRGMM